MPTQHAGQAKDDFHRQGRLAAFGLLDQLGVVEVDDLSQFLGRHSRAFASLSQPRTRLLDSLQLAWPLGARLGKDTSAVLAGSGLDHKTYAEPKTVLSLAQEFAIYANVSRLFATGDIGLRLGGLMTVNNFGLLGGLIANSRDVGHAGYLMRRFHALSSHWFTSEFVDELMQGKFVVRYRQTAELGQLSRMLTDLTVRLAQRALIDVFGAEAGLFFSEIAFGYPAPDDAGHYQHEFACPVSFGHEFTVVTCSKEVSKLLNQRRSEYTYRVLLQYCRDSAFSHSAVSWHRRVLNILACTDDYPSAEDVAQRLNCSERSLRRHLGSESVQYSELIDRIRFDRAVYLLRRSNHSMKNIAGQLSYSEPGAFIRAFSRWAGRTPTEFRQAKVAR